MRFTSSTAAASDRRARLGAVERAVFGDYEPEGFFDEAFAAPGKPRPHYEPLMQFIEQLGDDELTRRAHLRDASFRTKGITFTLTGDAFGAFVESETKRIGAILDQLNLGAKK